MESSDRPLISYDDKNDMYGLKMNGVEKLALFFVGLLILAGFTIVGAVIWGFIKVILWLTSK